MMKINIVSLGQSAELNDDPRDFGVVIAFGAKQVSDTCRQAARERNVGPYTISDRSLSSTRFDLKYHVISI